EIKRMLDIRRRVLLMDWLHLIILAPFIYACIVPFLYKYVPKVHTGWFVLLVPLTLFIYFIRHISRVANGDVIEKSVAWIPSLGIQFTAVIDGLGLLFA